MDVQYNQDSSTNLYRCTLTARPVGSTQIDDKANKWLQAELLKEDYADLSYEDRKTTTRIFEDMFQGVKISTGTSAVDSLPSLFFPVSHKVPNVVRRLELPKYVLKPLKVRLPPLMTITEKSSMDGSTYKSA